MPEATENLAVTDGRAHPRETEPPVVSVVIPCYRQIELARKCLTSVLRQEQNGMEVILLDDGHSPDYEQLCRKTGDPRVRYRRNPTRLGAMKNMFQAIGAGSGRYSIAFHEDDVLGPGYLPHAVSLLERYPECAFVAGELRFFDDEPALDSDAHKGDARYQLFDTAADFLRAILRGADPMFGSVVYRRRALELAKPDLDTLGTLCDRPFLLSLMKGFKAALMSEPRVYCRHHRGEDRRHESLTAEQILAFLRNYRSVLPAPLSRDDRKALTHFTQAWLPKLHRLIPSERRPPFRRLFLRALLDGVYDPRVLGLAGTKRVLRSMVT